MSKREALDHPELSHPSTKRAKQIDADNPYHHLQSHLSAQDEIKDVKKVAHWFRSKDLRIQDNIALHHASTLAAEQKVPLVCVYMHCPEEESWHGTSPARTDFISSTLALLQQELKDLHIPLAFLTAEKRSDQVSTLTEFLRANAITHAFANYEYYIDELRRDISVLEELEGDDIHISLHHDQCVLEPGTLLTNTGKPMKVFTPYHRAWLSTVKATPSLIDTVAAPSAQSQALAKDVETLFDHPVPQPGKDKKFKSEEEKKRIRKLWPPGHAAASQRMQHFLTKHITNYAATRSQPAENSTSRLSAYFSCGAFSVREALSAVRAHNNNSADFSEGGSSAGVYSWVREIVFRELYRQTSLATPHTAMNLPQNLKFESVQWEEDGEGWERWCQGRTGEPFVDAGMRQLNHEAYMHNRLRMNVSSYLYCNLLIDYRRGERYFAETLIDWDLSNNTNGWEPSYTVFNPVSQAERNDPDGEYIRKWVPELKDVEGKAVFAPYARLSKEEFEKLGYPKPHVDWKETKARAIERFKSDMRDASP